MFLDLFKRPSSGTAALEDFDIIEDGGKGDVLVTEMKRKALDLGVGLSGSSVKITQVVDKCMQICKDGVVTQSGNITEESSSSILNSTVTGGMDDLESLLNF